MSDIYKAIEDDHGKQRGLLAGIAETEGDSDERRRLFDLLKVELHAHADAEEQTLYAELLANPKSQEQTRHSVAEHKDMNDLIAELGKTDMSSPGWIATFKKLRHDVEHHLDEEEKDVFELARKVLSEDEAEEIGRRFHDRKAKEEAAA